MGIFRNLLSNFGNIGTIIALFALAYQIKKDRHFSEWDQASKIAVWLKEANDTLNEVIHISNSSAHPIYEVILSVDRINDEIRKGDSCFYISCVPPGEYKVLVEYQGRGMHNEFNASISFRDTIGKYWCRNASGILIRSQKNCWDQRKLIPPLNSESLENDKI